MLSAPCSQQRMACLVPASQFGAAAGRVWLSLATLRLVALAGLAQLASLELAGSGRSFRFTYLAGVSTYEAPAQGTERGPATAQSVTFGDSDTPWKS